MATKLSRRRLLQIASGASLSLFAGCITDSGKEVPTADPRSSAVPVLTEVGGYGDARRWEGRTLVIATPGDEGSAYLESQVGAIFEPFQRLTGAVVRTVRTDIAALKQQVNEAEVVWSVCDIPAERVLPLANSAIISEIDYSIVDQTDLFEPFVMQHGVGANLYATALGYFLGEETNPSRPENWQDFWDFDHFPGPRGFQETPLGTLEFALLSSGVDRSELYPLDVTQAFRRLNVIVDNIALWWRQGAQPTQMIAAGDLTMVAVWHDRIQGLAASGAAVSMSWESSQINGDSWVVPNGAPEADMAMDFVNFATRPEVTAEFSSRFPFGPVNNRAYELIESEDDRVLPGDPSIRDEQFVVDLEWWFRNREPVEEQFQEWLAETPEDS